ncbi:hypothetical protein CAPN006_07430 [Capnocytophaga canimorsus]|nr:hypothetical protein CAPN006_07430 [Capnocytophaga canimorsus]
MYAFILSINLKVLTNKYRVTRIKDKVKRNKLQVPSYKDKVERIKVVSAIC